MQKITPFLWFNDNAEDAAKFYVSVFKNSSMLEALPGPGGKPLTVTFQLEGQEFIALNGGPHYQITPGVSFFTKCTTQEEIDYLWNALLDGGKPMQCGWLTDKFGVSWQIVPIQLGEMLKSGDREKSTRAMNAMMSMVKLDLGALRRAYDGVD
jgi:predicted 3-demethylubiquinone-9 3-methyltransferase (glyoxalase superfamily)